ncbi:MAG: glycine cleavage system aminomethyltransferase GcvT [Spirochaetales bacterium]|jgi:glycine cleavage system T protein|nr:glycine cleavage system aminomethyltransferase GcvT [Spirochaetales bacterium]
MSPFLQETESFKHTPLSGWHKIHGGRLVPFAGWEMPLQYASGPVAEHHLVRRGAGLFDVSHMGRFDVSGKRAGEFLDFVLSADISGMEEFQSGYALICREDGGILDDVFVYRQAAERYRVVVNASNAERDLAWFRRHAESFQIEVRDISAQSAMIAFQGPRALDMLSVCIRDFTAPRRFFWGMYSIAGSECMIARTGYTGEDGVEIITPAGKAVEIWEALLNMGAEPVGLAARDSLRFEAGFPLYGHELFEEVTPVEAGVLWACDFSKNFIGRDAIAARKSEGAEKKLVTFVMVEKSVAREGYAVMDEAGQIIGGVTSGMLAPTLNVFAGNAFVRREYANTGQAVYISIRGAGKKAELVKRPLYIPAYRGKPS